ncbi:helix-turn-helix transcriptional regulator [Streptomyces daliensis]|uniref:GAF domain-containing protein n=1 Tax=Streptomyces daliensis TaxID=299421 RepID=A0A8T4IRD0_9ACTN|nr:GAF domain-containing protein [Streptomyces daliensis]
MVRFSARDAEITAEIARVGTLPGEAAERAEALLAPIRRLISYDAAFIHLYDPDRSLQVPLLHEGYDEQVGRYMTTPEFTADVDGAGGQGHRPFRLKDLSQHWSEIPLWADYLSPAGFREGIGVPLRTASGSYLGFLGVTTVESRPPAPSVRDRLGALASLIAQAVDPLRSLTARASLVAGATAAVVLTRAGRTSPLPGLPGHRLLTEGSPVLAAAEAQLAEGHEHSVFLAPDGEAAAPPSVLRVTVLSCPRQPPGHLYGLVLLSPPPELHGLTRRELELCGHLVRGASNAEIAAALAITPRTVAAHLEHVFAKLGVSSRSMAAVRVLRQGLHLPPQVVA